MAVRPNHQDSRYWASLRERVSTVIRVGLCDGRSEKALRELSLECEPDSEIRTTQKRIIDLLLGEQFADFDPLENQPAPSNMPDDVLASLALFGCMRQFHWKESAIRTTIRDTRGVENVGERQIFAASVYGIGPVQYRARDGRQQQLVERLVEELFPKARRTDMPEYHTEVWSQASTPYQKMVKEFDDHQPRARQIEEDFFSRKLTQDYISMFVDLDPITIYTDADFFGTSAVPVSSELIANLLYLATEDSKSLGVALDQKQIARVVDEVTNLYPPAFVGTIAKHFASDALGDLLEQARDASIRTKSSLSERIQSLAFALLAAGKRVQIVTTSVTDMFDLVSPEDDEDSSSSPRLVRRSPSDFSKKEYTTLADDNSHGRIPVCYLNGSIDSKSYGKPLIGEEDLIFFQSSGHAQFLGDCFNRTDVVFVGSNLTETTLIKTLIAANFHRPRIAILQAPDLRSDELSNSLSSSDRSLLRNLVGRRYSDLKVAPIFVDSPDQACQLLAEVEFQVRQFEKSKSPPTYDQRLRVDWWDKWADLFGYQPDGTIGERNAALQLRWHEELRLILAEINHELLGLPNPEHGEKTGLEVWLRNPLDDTLFLWSSTSGLLLDGQGAPRHALGRFASDADNLTVKSFQEVQIQYGAVDSASNPWRYQVSRSLTLTGSRWGHLPIGVISLLSDRADDAGRLVLAEERPDSEALFGRFAGKIAHELTDPKILSPKTLAGRRLRTTG